MTTIAVSREVEAAQQRFEKSKNPHLAEIEKYLANPPTGSILLTITPDMATAILDKYNIENRPLKPGRIRQLVRDIREGRWLLTGEAIKFASTHRLLDGQNRLSAIAEAGVAVQTHCIFGLPDQAFAVIDTGSSRTAGDVLSMAKVPEHTTIAHMISWVYTLETAPGYRHSLPLTPSLILDLYQTRYRDAVDSLSWGSLLRQALAIPKSRGATLHYVFKTFGGAEKADKFMSAWIGGGHDRSVQQVEALRLRFARLYTITGGQVSAVAAYATAIKAWNAFIEGRHVTPEDIAFGEGEPMPQVLGK